MKKIIFALSLGIFLLNCPSLARSQTPTLSLKDSLPIAEAALVKNQVDPAQYFIFSITYTNSRNGYFWYYTFRPIDRSSGAREIHLKIYMDNTTEFIGS